MFVFQKAFNLVYDVCISDLIYACQVRETAALTKAIHRAKKVNYKKALTVQIMIATNILKRLSRIEKISESILDLNQNMLTEMKKYQTPPTGVYEALLTTFILLGEDMKSMKVGNFLESWLGHFIFLKIILKEI